MMILLYYYGIETVYRVSDTVIKSPSPYPIR